ncbi:hypothetical protein DPSP01_013942 [Paraphaeosphaeria sporulosa]
MESTGSRVMGDPIVGDERIKVGRLISRDNNGSKFTIGSTDLVWLKLGVGTEFLLLPDSNDGRGLTFTDGPRMEVGNDPGRRDSAGLGLAEAGSKSVGKILLIADSNGLRSDRGRLDKATGGVTRGAVPSSVLACGKRTEDLPLTRIEDSGFTSKDGLTLERKGAVDNLEATSTGMELAGMTGDGDPSPNNENTGLRLISDGIVTVGILGSTVNPRERSTTD